MMEVNNHLPPFKAHKSTPDPNFKYVGGYELPAPSVQYQLVWTDETVINKNTTREVAFHDTKGAGTSGTGGPGERVAMVLFLSRDGIDGWDSADYTKLQDLFLYNMGPESNTGHAKAWRDALMFMCKETGLPRDLNSWLPPQNPSGFASPNNSSYGRYGIYVWEVAAAKKETEFHNMDNDMYVIMVTKQAMSWTTPTFLVMDQSRVHNTIAGFDPWKSDTSKTATETFLREHFSSAPSNEYGKLYSELFDTAVNPHVLKAKITAPKLIARVKAVMKTRPLSRVEVILAEIGMQRFGLPHRVILIPARMPDFNPCEFVFGVIKDDYKRHRFARFDANGNLLGPQGLLEFRANVCRMISDIDQGQMRRCARHSEDIMRWHFSSPRGETPDTKILNKALADALLKAKVTMRLGGVVYSKGPAFVESSDDDDREESEEEARLLEAVTGVSQMAEGAQGEENVESDDDSGENVDLEVSDDEDTARCDSDAPSPLNERSYQRYGDSPGYIADSSRGIPSPTSTSIEVGTTAGGRKAISRGDEGRQPTSRARHSQRESSKALQYPFLNVAPRRWS